MKQENSEMLFKHQVKGLKMCENMSVLGLVLENGGLRICKYHYSATEVHKNMRS